MAQPVWVTAAGTLGTYPASFPLTIIFVATPVLPATTISYKVLSGTIPDGLTFNTTGILFGTPSIQRADTSYQFVLRATDNLGNVSDRTFDLTVSGVATPQLTTPPGFIFTVNDSIWKEFQIEFFNPEPDNPVRISLFQGQLPPGLEINEAGKIRGYAEPPITTISYSLINTVSTATSSSDNSITVTDTTSFAINRPIVFTGGVLGGLNPGQEYFVQSILSSTKITVSTTQDGLVYPVTTETGVMAVTLPAVNTGQPTIRTFSFTLRLDSPLGSDTELYFIEVKNQNAPVIQGGPGLPANSRIPTLYNTRPPTFDILESTDYRYYSLPPDGLITGNTYLPTQFAYIGKYYSDNYFAFKMLGKDFDNNQLTYTFADLPLGLSGDSETGWVTGVPSIADNSISQFNFSVNVSKSGNPGIFSPFFNFSFLLTNNITGDIEWVTPEDLGSILNSSISLKKVEAISDVSLQYRLTNDSNPLPPNLVLQSNGEITGRVAYQPLNILAEENTSTEFSFTVEAFNTDFSVVLATRTFKLTVIQAYDQPLDNLYMKCTPGLEDRVIIDDLLTSNTLIPSNYLYRPEDSNFGKANAVVYTHAYGIHASDLKEYVDATQINHYWRNIILGPLKTAIARDPETNEILYEVVYSTIVDDLTKFDSEQDGFAKNELSISKEITWPRNIDLGLGPWYTSSTMIYTSYIDAQAAQLTTQYGADLLTQGMNELLIQQGLPFFHTSLSPGYARYLYPASLPNMRKQVGNVLGQNFNSNILPLWMSSQQLDGSTLGYVQAWVIAYCKPLIIVNSEQYTLEEFNALGLDRTQYNSLAEQVVYNINNNWVNSEGNNITLNTINFQIDRFTVDKSMTYDFDNFFTPPVWTDYPSATPVPNPIDSQDFYVVFPQTTILPKTPQQY